MDYETGRSKGFAHVQFEEVAGAAAAIAKSGSEMEGRELFIDSAKERPASGNTPNSNRFGEFERGILALLWNSATRPLFCTLLSEALRVHANIWLNFTLCDQGPNRMGTVTPRPSL